MTLAIGYGIWTDWTSWKIRNHLTYPLLLMGVVVQGWRGMWGDLAVGFLLGFVPLLVLFIFGGMGAGDVKFGAALGVWLGGEKMLQAYAVSGLILFCYLLVSGRLFSVFRNFGPALQKLIERHHTEGVPTTRVPYGVFLGLGAGVSLWMGG